LIAEGVETQAEADTLQRLGIEFAQGFLYGRPERLNR
jgi:EAL domain-containing protein (putative c-di-GMP-specific phosphodiesterase class I)